MIKVCFCATRSLYDKLAITLTSLWHHNPDAFVYLILEDDEFPYFKSSQFKIINVADLDLDVRDTNPNLNRFCTYMSLVRAYLPAILTDEPKVISCDVDLIFNGNLDDVWSWDMRDNYILATPEFQKTYPNNNILHFNEPYVNTGVCIMNLDLMRKHHIVEQLSDFMNVISLSWPDQDALNYICKGHIMLLPQTYNSNMYTGMPIKPIILHGTPNKPWDGSENNYLYPVWQYYEEMYKNEYTIANIGENKNAI